VSTPDVRPSDVQVVRGSRSWLASAAALAAVLALGLLAEQLVTARLAEIQALSETDMIRARAELAGLLRVGSACLFGLTGAAGLSIVLSSGRALAEGRFPPSGIWSWGAVHVVTGPRARTFARVCRILGALVIALSAAAAALAWHMASVLLACRA
jgi:hypothetical protein